MIKTILLIAGLSLLAACSHATRSLEVMEISEHFASTEYQGVVTDITTTYKQKFRSYENANIAWSTYMHSPRLRSVYNLKGKIDFKIDRGVMREEIHDFVMHEKRQFAFWRDLNTTTPWPDDYTYPMSATLIMSEKTNLGEMIAFDLLYKKNGKKGKATPDAQGSLLHLLALTTIVLGDEELKTGEFDIALGEEDENGNKTDMAARVSGETIWKSRPSIKIDITGLTKMKIEKDNKTYDINIKGYMLIDKYTGSTVLLDVESELDSKHWNADLYMRNVLEIDLDPSTPLLTDHFALGTTKAAQLWAAFMV